ncbi:dimethyl sulfoxide reductase anchor subunit [Ahrensia sp. AH-315-G08]|nr:dimethyl sulfoxide reductase anchor subunit [Ahrensia sp. AH-315-G08]
MRPAFSVIIFTVLSGAGYGLAFFLALGLAAPDVLLTKIAWVVAIGLVVAGLISSTLHLGNPQRAWRAFSQWRSSWLSREGCAAVITFLPLCSLAIMSIFYDTWSLPLGLLAALCCAITVYCTGMIYASLRSIITWYTVLTPLCYLAFSVSSGLLILRGFFSNPVPGARDWLGISIIGGLFAAWFVKYMWARRARFLGYGASSAETATGLGYLGKVRLLERPHTMENYLTHEMGFRIGRKHAGILWRITVLLGLFLPMILCVLALTETSFAPVFFAAAALFHIIGLLFERWLFFANARHAVGLYYGDEG